MIRPRNTPPNANEFGQLISYLRRYKPTNLTQGQWNQQVTDWIGINPSARTRGELIKHLIEQINNLPRGRR
jgi:hypothetical protein